MSRGLISIKLDDEELTTLKELAKLRYEYARKRGIKDEKVGDQSCAETDFIGICAEFAFCKHFNLYPDIGVEKAKPVDCVMGGFTIDVKGTKYHHGHLILRKTSNHEACDLYVLVTGDPNKSMIIRGWIKGSKFISDNHLGRMKENSPLSYIANQESLTMFKAEE